MVMSFSIWSLSFFCCWYFILIITYNKTKTVTHLVCCCSPSIFYDRGRSFFSRYNAHNETLATLTTLKRTPGISPTAWPLRPKPAMRTSSFSYENKTTRKTMLKFIITSIYLDVVKTTIAWYESSDLLAILDQLNSNTFTNSWVRLFSFDTAKMTRTFSQEKKKY